MIYCFAVLAAVGLALSITAHIAALLGKPGPLGGYVWTLHFGALAVCIPAILVLRRVVRGIPRKDQWQAALRGCPPWMKYTVYVFVGYALVNFIIFLTGGSSRGGSGPMSPAAVRGFSGHWMALYAVALAILYSGARDKNSHPPQAS